MSLYTSLSEQTSSAAPGQVILGVPDSFTSQTITSDDAERVERIKTNGLTCLGRLHGDLTFGDWLGVGAALQIITQEALVEVGAFKWDPNNKRLVKTFHARWEEYEISAGRNDKPLTKQERCALREVMSNPEISAWRSTLTGPDKRRLNYPHAVIKRYRARQKAMTVPAETRKPSPHAMMKATNIALQEENHRLKQRGDGNTFTVSDSPKDIAATIIGTFDGRSNKTSKVEAIARELSAWVKQQKMAAE